MITADMLRHVPLFATLHDGDLSEVAVAAADMQLVAGEWLVHEGEVPSFFILLSGDLEVSKTVAGAEQVINQYHPGDTFGEVPLLLGSMAVANLRAIGAARVARLEAAEFHNLLARSEKVAAGITRTMAQRVAHLQQISVDTPTPTALIVGYRSDLECHDVREFFLQHRRAFRWLDPADPAAAPHIPADLQDGPYPAVMLAGGTVLRCPSARELAERLGLQTTPRQSRYDVIIIGGGPAGLAAAVYGASEGLGTLMVERAAPGGQAGTSSRIENYLGFPTGLSGDDLGARALQQATRFGAEIVVTRTVTAIRAGAAKHEVALDGEDRVAARTIILATGVSWRALSVPGAAELVGRGIYYGAARTEAPSARGKDVYLVGGGNSAGQAAMFFANYARQVTLLIRGDSIQRGMSSYLIDQLATKQNVAVRCNATVTAVHGSRHLEAITVRDEAAQAEERHETDALFVFIGADAETGWLPPDFARDERGYLLTGAAVRAGGRWPLERDPYLLETSVPGIFAAGDVRHGSIKRVASGVGEGSMAIAFVHQYLAL